MIKKYRFSLLLSLVILILSLAPPATFERVDFLEMTFTDKLVHMAMYFGLMSVMTWENSKYNARPAIIAAAAFAAFLYGILIEFMQEFLTTNRTGSVWDAMFNTFGILLAVALWLAIGSFSSRKNIR